MEIFQCWSDCHRFLPEAVTNHTQKQTTVLRSRSHWQVWQNLLLWVDHHIILWWKKPISLNIQNRHIHGWTNQERGGRSDAQLSSRRRLLLLATMDHRKMNHSEARTLYSERARWRPLLWSAVCSYAVGVWFGVRSTTCKQTWVLSYRIPICLNLSSLSFQSGTMASDKVKVAVRVRPINRRGKKLFRYYCRTRCYSSCLAAKHLYAHCMGGYRLQ